MNEIAIFFYFFSGISFKKLCYFPHTFLKHVLLTLVLNMCFVILLLL